MKKAFMVILSLAIALAAFATPTFAATAATPVPPPQPIAPPAPSQFVQTIVIRELDTEYPYWSSSMIIRAGRSYEVKIAFKNIGGTDNVNFKVSLPHNVAVDFSGDRWKMLANNASQDISNIDGCCIEASINGNQSVARYPLVTFDESVTTYFIDGSVKATNPSNPEGISLGEYSDAILSGIDLRSYAANKGAEITFAFQVVGGVIPELPKTASGYECEHQVPTLTSDGVVLVHYANKMDHGNYMPTRAEVIGKIHETAFPGLNHDKKTVTEWAIRTGLVKGHGNSDYAWDEIATLAEIYAILDRYDRIFLGEAPARSSYTAAGFPEWARPGAQRAYVEGYYIYDNYHMDGVPFEVFIHILGHTAIGGGMG